jgi:hypothetical protein
MEKSRIKKIEIAKSQIGAAEEPQGTNSGLVVDEYLKSVGLPPGFSWCMAFVYWCCKQADPNTPLVRTGGVLKQWQKIDPKYKRSRPMEGDIFIQDRGRGLGHCGFIEKIEGGILHTIEGNSNSTGSREGYEVCRQQRKPSSCIGFIRLL